jgi:SAM-dependent methyltransferase
MSSRSELKRLLAASMDADPWLLPYLPELFRDVEDLGVRAQDVVSVLRDSGIEAAARVLDLGCGKGAAALAVCESFAASVLGVDGMPDFVAHATANAAGRGLSQRCTFEVEDVRRTVLRARGYDVVMLLGLGPMFGDAGSTIAVLRRSVRSGGLIVIDDAYLEPGAPFDAELVDCHDRVTTLRLLESSGDTVIAERVIDTDENQDWYRRVTEAIVARAQALAERRPDLAEGLLEFAARQRRETEVLSGPLVGALFALRVSAR